MLHSAVTGHNRMHQASNSSSTVGVMTKPVLGSLLQDPVVTVAWSVANYVLQGQIMGFKLDTWPHCLGPTSNPPLIAITLIIIMFAHLFVAGGFLFTHRPLSLYRFPTKFRNEFWGILLGAAGFFVAARALKQVVLRKQQARIQAKLRGNSPSRLSSARASLGSGSTGLPSAGGSLGGASWTALRAQSRELTTKFWWLTLRAPKIAPLVPGLSRSMTHAHSHPETERVGQSGDALFKSASQLADDRV